MPDHTAAVERESGRFLRAITASGLDDRVPSCPDWSVADLAWHLAKVQHFWATIVEDLLDDPDAVPELDHPGPAGLAELVERQSARLVTALASRSPSDPCWSWHDGGHHVAWVRRRQAHEALIHRVDAQLSVGRVEGLDEELAVDGVDEVLTVSIDASDLPGWALFEPTGHHVEIRVPSSDRHWTCELGWFRGTSPTSGSTYDEEALRLLAGEPDPAGTVISGTGAALDLWLWGRGPASDLEVAGETEAVSFVRAAAAAATQ